MFCAHRVWLITMKRMNLALRTTQQGHTRSVAVVVAVAAAAFTVAFTVVVVVVVVVSLIMLAQVYTAKKAELVAKQSQLAERGAPITIITLITASGGERSPILHSTLLLGISLLKEGNQRIQDVSKD